MDYSEKWGVDVEEAVKLALQKDFLALVRNWQK